MHKRTTAEKNDVLFGYLTILGRCYSSGRFDELFPLLSDEAVMESQWVLNPNSGKGAVIRYYTDKGKVLRSSGCFPLCSIVRFVGNCSSIESSELHINGNEPVTGSVSLFYPPNKYALLMSQTINGNTADVILDLTLDDNDLISRIDLCMPELFRFECINVDKKCGNIEPL